MSDPNEEEYVEDVGLPEYPPAEWPWGEPEDQEYPVFPKGMYAAGGDFGSTPRPLYVDGDGNLFVYEKDGFTFSGSQYGKAPAPISQTPVYAGWPSVEEIRILWTGAPDDEDGLLSLLRAAAIAQCEAFAPEPSGASVIAIPANWKLALVMQVKNLNNASMVGPSGSTSEGDLGMTPFPLTWQVKALLRPKRGRPLVG